MTKLKRNASEMLKLLRTGRYRLTEEEAELIKRKEYQETTGMRTPRPKRQNEEPVSFRRRGMADTCSQNYFFCDTSRTPTFEELPGDPEDLFKGNNPDCSWVNITVSAEFGSSNHSSAHRLRAQLRCRC